MQENHFLKSEKEKEILLHKETQEKLMKSLEEGDKLLQEIRRLTESVVQPDLATRKDSAVENREVLQHHFQGTLLQKTDVTTVTDWDTSRHTATKDKMISITESGQSKNKNQPKKSGLDPIHAAVENYVSNPSTDNKEDDIPNSLNKCTVKWRLNFNIVADDEGTTHSSFPKENPPDVHAARRTTTNYPCLSSLNDSGFQIEKDDSFETEAMPIKVDSRLLVHDHAEDIGVTKFTTSFPRSH
nr:uncharacterized protein LOC109163398 [Ipomoea batatas]